MKLKERLEREWKRAGNTWLRAHRLAYDNDIYNGRDNDTRPMINGRRRFTW